MLRDQWQSQMRRIMCWVLAGIGISTARTDCPRAAIACDEAQAPSTGAQRPYRAPTALTAIYAIYAIAEA